MKIFQNEKNCFYNMLQSVLNLKPRNALNNIELCKKISRQYCKAIEMGKKWGNFAINQLNWKIRKSKKTEINKERKKEMDFFKAEMEFYKNSKLYEILLLKRILFSIYFRFFTFSY